MINQIYLVLLGVFLLSSCKVSTSSENEIYSKALNELFPDKDTLIIRNVTLVNSAEVIEEYKNTNQAYYDYLIKSKRVYDVDLPKNLLKDKTITLVSNDDINSPDFLVNKSKNTSGLITISPIGYSNDSSRVWLQISNFKGGYSGYDATVRMQKIEGRWQVLGDITKAYY